MREKQEPERNGNCNQRPEQLSRDRASSANIEGELRGRTSRNSSFLSRRPTKGRGKVFTPDKSASEREKKTRFVHLLYFLMGSVAMEETRLWI